MSCPAVVSPSEEELDKTSHKKSHKSHNGSVYSHSLHSKKTAKTNVSTKKKSESEARAAKDREKKLEKLYDLWKQAKENEREDQNQYYKERVVIQHDLIQKQDLLYQMQQSKSNAKLHRIKESRRLTKISQSKHYSDFVKDALAQEKLLKSTLKSHSRVISSHQPSRLPLIISESPVRSADSLDRGSTEHTSAEGTVKESSLLSDNFSDLVNESVEVQLQVLLGSEAEDFLKPTFREGAKKSLDPLIDKYRGVGAHQLWGVLRGKSNKKLEKEDGRIHPDLKNAYRSFIRECYHADVPIVERSFCRNEDQIPEEKISESVFIKDINFARHRLDLMYRVAHMNKDKTRLLFRNMESADTKEGSVRPPQYNPNQIQKPKAPLLALPPSESQDSTTEAKKLAEPCAVGGEKITFLTEKMATCKGEFSKRHNAAGSGNDEVSPREKELSRQCNIRGALSAPVSSQGQRQTTQECVKSWQPLSIEALLEYKTSVTLPGSGKFLQGQPRRWKVDISL